MKPMNKLILWGGAAAGLVAGCSGIFTRPASFLLGSLPRRFSHHLLGGELVPLHSRMLGLYAGLALALACFFVFGYRRLCFRPGFDFLKTRPGKFLFVLLAVLALLTLSLSVNRVFWDDEVEHIHASWYVQQGQVPYRDFFEHHHPLLWFLLVPLISLLGEGLAVLAAARLLALLMAAGIGWLTWRISRLAGGSAETAGLAVVILFANILFLPCVMEIRPDVPMVLLALAAVERLLVFVKEGKTGHLLAAAFLAAISFLFLQKVILLFPAAVVMFFVWRWRGRIASALFWKTAAVFLLPLVAFMAWLIFSGAFRDYFLCNWPLNARRQVAFSLWLYIGRMALVNIVFWLSLLPVLMSIFRSKKSFSPVMNVLAWFGFSALALLFLLPRPADRHFLLVLPLLSVLIAAWAGDRSQFPFPGHARKIYLAGLLVVPLPFLAALSFPLNGVQLEKIAYVLRLTAPEDKVYDGRSQFNLFRPDLHYFWFQIDRGEMLENYRRLRGGLRAAYDPCRLVRENNPRFIRLDRSEWTACSVWREYFPTPYTDLFIRRP